MKERLSLGTRVRCQDGPAGLLDGVVMNPDTKEPAYLVVEQHRPVWRRIVVHIGLVADIGADGIALNTTCDALQTYPDFETTIKRRVRP